MPGKSFSQACPFNDDGIPFKDGETLRLPSVIYSLRDIERVYLPLSVDDEARQFNVFAGYLRDWTFHRYHLERHGKNMTRWQYRYHSQEMENARLGCVRVLAGIINE